MSSLLMMLLPIIIIQFILMIVALIDLVKIPQTNGPKWLWAIVIVCVSIIGSIIYFIFGRKQV